MVGQDRTPTPTPAPASTPGNPCQSEDDAYTAAVAAQRETQRKLGEINSAAKEKAVKATNDEAAIANWRSAVKTATDANLSAVAKVDKTFKEREDCFKKNRRGGTR